MPLSLDCAHHSQKQLLPDFEVALGLLALYPVVLAVSVQALLPVRFSFGGWVGIGFV